MHEEAEGRRMQRVLWLFRERIATISGSKVACNSTGFQEEVQQAIANREPIVNAWPALLAVWLMRAASRYGRKPTSSNGSAKAAIG